MFKEDKKQTHPGHAMPRIKVNEEGEKKKKITSEDLHDGWDSHVGILIERCQKFEV